MSRNVPNVLAVLLTFVLFPCASYLLGQDCVQKCRTATNWVVDSSTCYKYDQGTCTKSAHFSRTTNNQRLARWRWAIGFAQVLSSRALTGGRELREFRANFRLASVPPRIESEACAEQRVRSVPKSAPFSRKTNNQRLARSVNQQRASSR